MNVLFENTKWCQPLGKKINRFLYIYFYLVIRKIIINIGNKLTFDIIYENKVLPPFHFFLSCLKIKLFKEISFIVLSTF